VDIKLRWFRKKSSPPFARHSRGNGNPVFSMGLQVLDSRLRGNDDFLRVHQLRCSKQDLNPFWTQSRSKNIGISFANEDTDHWIIRQFHIRDWTMSWPLFLWTMSWTLSFRFKVRRSESRRKIGSQPSGWKEPAYPQNRSLCMSWFLLDFNFLLTGGL